MRLILIFFLFSTFVLHAQVTEQKEANNNDSSIVENGNAPKEAIDTTHSPPKAALLSLLPGAGQVYNHLAMPKGKKKAFWKIPIIYIGLGVTGYFAIKNHVAQKTLKEEYLFRNEYGYPNPDLPEYAGYDKQGILTLYENKKRNRDLMIFAFVAVYGLNILDAYAEAHFVNFDVSKDLSMNIRPKMQDLRTLGIAIRFNFR